MIRVSSRRLGIVIAFVVGVAACSPAAPPHSPASSLAPGAVVTLPILAGWNGGCRGIGLDKALLTGDPADPRLAWLTTPTGRRDVLFPPGLTAAFSPRLVIMDSTGAVVARDGDAIDGGCVTGPNADGPLLILGG